jgi:Type I phosphodiesterase / nucleotide pyrophosphatase
MSNNRYVKLIAAALALTATFTHPAGAGKATLNLVLVIDGLRPDSITPEETPNLWRLRQEGVNFLNSHSVFPTVTRVNATAIGSGANPDRNATASTSRQSTGTTRLSTTTTATCCAWTRRPAATWCW